MLPRRQAAAGSPWCEGSGHAGSLLPSHELLASADLPIACAASRRYTNSVRIVQLDEESHQFVDCGGFEHPYPTTKIMWMQLGAVGLILFIVLLTRLFVKTWRLGVHNSNALYLWPLLLLVTQLVRGITESRLLIQSAMMMLILFAVKSYDPEELLEENFKKTKRKQLEQISKRPITRLIRR